MQAAAVGIFLVSLLRVELKQRAIIVHVHLRIVLHLGVHVLVERITGWVVHGILLRLLRHILKLLRRHEKWLEAFTVRALVGLSEQLMALVVWVLGDASSVSVLKVLRL